MSLLTRTIENKNLLSALWFNFLIKKAPTFSYFIQSVNIPDLNAGVATMNTPFVVQPFSGDHMTFGDMSITFKVDEDMLAYKEIYDWIIGINFPNEFPEYARLYAKEKTTGEGVYADATLTVLSSTKRPNLEFTFYDIFPIGLSSLQFDSTTTDTDYLTCTATFKYRKFDMRTI